MPCTDEACGKGCEVFEPRLATQTEYEEIRQPLRRIARHDILGVAVGGWIVFNKPEEYPGPWMSDPNRSIVEVLAQNNIRDCGEFYGCFSVPQHPSYLISSRQPNRRSERLLTVRRHSANRHLVTLFKHSESPPIFVPYLTCLAIYSYNPGTGIHDICISRKVDPVAAACRIGILSDKTVCLP